MSMPEAAGGFELDRQRHLRAYADRLPIEAERLTWPLEQLHGLRDERLRALLRTAKARSAWHRSRLVDIDPDTVTGADLAAIPTMTNADVMEHWDEIVTDRRLTLELAEAHLERVAAEGPAYLLGDYQVLTTEVGTLGHRHEEVAGDHLTSVGDAKAGEILAGKPQNRGPFIQHAPKTRTVAGAMREVPVECS